MTCPYCGKAALVETGLGRLCTVCKSSVGREAQRAA